MPTDVPAGLVFLPLGSVEEMVTAWDSQSDWICVCGGRR